MNNSKKPFKSSFKNSFKGKKNFNPVKKSVVKESNRIPKHIISLALIIRNNAEIRRFTALGIINYLSQKGEISGTRNYVMFKLSKFSVESDGLAREYLYTEPFFLNALVASFASFSASAQRTIDNFINTELTSTIDDVVDVNEVQKMITDIANRGTEVDVEVAASDDSTEQTVDSIEESSN